MIEIGSQEWITRHFEVGEIRAGYEVARVLACRHCGAFVWDTVTHMEALHLDEMDVVGDE